MVMSENSLALSGLIPGKSPEWAMSGYRVLLAITSLFRMKVYINRLLQSIRFV